MTTESTEVAVVETQRSSMTLTAADIKAQVQLIQEVLQAVMQEGHHYGVIPGTTKPTLLKPGAEKLAVTFRLAPIIKKEEQRDLPNGHREHKVIIELIHIPTGKSYGEGIGICSTMESRYRWRNADLACPQCGKSAIIKGKAEYGGGWVCFQRKGGCGAKFSDKDPQITGQAVGKTETPDIADSFNTIVKMAKKRALIDGVLTATAASDFFTQDLEETSGDDTAGHSSTSKKPQPETPSQEERPLRTVAKSDTAVTPSAASIAWPSLHITKEQFEILLLSCSHAKISEADLKQHVQTTYGVTELRHILQKDLNSILEWLAAKSALSAEIEPSPETGNQLPPEQPKPTEAVTKAQDAAPANGGYPWKEGIFKGGILGDKAARQPNHIAVQTENGERDLTFFSRPIALKKFADWSQLVNKKCRVKVAPTKKGEKTYYNLLDIDFPGLQIPVDVAPPTAPEDDDIPVAWENP